MAKWFARHAAPIAALALGAGLSGCAYMDDWDEEEVAGVPLEELDMSGDAPDTIRLRGPDRVVISEGDTLTITLEGNAEAGEALRFDRQDNRLSIARDKNVYDGSQSATVIISMPAPTNLEIAGSGDIESATMASDAKVEIAGSGNIRVTSLTAQRFDIEIAGSGNVGAAGTAERLSVEINGAGEVELEELMADDVTVEIAGSGDVELSSNGSVKAEIAGSGDVRVTGSATCSVETAGSGSLTCRPAATAAAAIADETETEDAAAE